MSLTEQHPVTKQYPRTVYQDEGSLHMMKSPNCLEMKDRIFTVDSSAARCQLFKFDSISALSNLIFDIIGFARTSQEYHQRFPSTDKKLQFLHKFYQNIIQYLKNQTDIWQFCQSISNFEIIRCWFKHCL